MALSAQTRGCLCVAKVRVYTRPIDKTTPDHSTPVDLNYSRSVGRPGPKLSEDTA